MPATTCAAEGCDSTPTAKGMCARHRMRVLRHGDASVVLKPWARTARERAFRPTSWDGEAVARVLAAAERQGVRVPLAEQPRDKATGRFVRRG